MHMHGKALLLTTLAAFHFNVLRRSTWTNGRKHFTLHLATMKTELLVERRPECEEMANSH